MWLELGEQIFLLWEQLQASSVLKGILQVRQGKCEKSILSVEVKVESYIFIKP